MTTQEWLKIREVLSDRIADIEDRIPWSMSEEEAEESEELEEVNELLDLLRNLPGIGEVEV